MCFCATVTAAAWSQQAVELHFHCSMHACHMRAHVNIYVLAMRFVTVKK